MHEPYPHQAVFRVNDTYTFESLKSDTCRYFEVHPLDMLLSDDHDEEWGGDRYVRSELERLENTYGRVFLKFLSREEDELGEDPEDLLALLAGEEDPEEEAKPAAAAVAAAGATIAPLTEQAAAPKKKKLDKRQLWMELPAFLTFFCMCAPSPRNGMHHAHTLCLPAHCTHAAHTLHARCTHAVCTLYARYTSAARALRTRRTRTASAHLPACPSPRLPICPSAHIPIRQAAHLPGSYCRSTLGAA